jgi:hypothetical protein
MDGGGDSSAGRRRREPGGGAMARFTDDGYSVAPVCFPQHGLLLRGRRDAGNSPMGSPEGGVHWKMACDGGQFH